MKTFRVLLVAFSLFLSVVSAIAAPDSGADSLKNVWNNPPRSAYPGTRWQIQGNALRPEDIAAYIAAIRAQDIMGLEIMSYSPIYEKGNVLYGSPAYFEMVKEIVAQCKKRGMWVTLNFGPGWGLGNAWVSQTDGSKTLVYDELGTMAGPVNLKIESPRKKSAPFAQRQPKKLETLLAIKMDGEKLLPEQVVDLTAQVAGDQHRWEVKPSFTLQTTLPAGRWRLVAFWTVLTGQHCAAGSGSVDVPGNPPGERLVDHLDHNAVSRFAEGTFAKFAPYIGEEFGKTVDCVFGDSFELEQEDFFWSDGFFDEFKKVKGYNLKPLLPQMIYGGTEKTPFIRYDFNHFLHLKGMEGIIGTMADVCESHGMRQRQQPHYRFAAELMEASGRVKRAETEWNVRRLDPKIYPHKLTTSGVRLYGGDWVSCEAYTFIGPKYKISLEDLKASADGFMRDGVAQIISSTGYYQPEGYLEPFRDVTWSVAQISPTTSWFPYMRHLNDYIARSCAVLQNTKFTSDVLVYSPQASVWSERVEFPAKHVRDIPFGPLGKMLVAAGYDFDTINDDLLINRAEARSGEMRVNDYAYHTIVLPRVLYLPPAALEKIKTFVENGGLAIALDTLPMGAVGLKDLENNQADVKALVGQLFAAGGGEKSVGKGKTWFLPSCKGIDYIEEFNAHSKDYEPTVVPPGWQAFLNVMWKNVTPDVQFAGGKVSQGLTFYRAKSGDRDVFFLMNLSPTPVDESVVLHARQGGSEKWNPMTGEITAFPECRPTADGRMEAHVRLAPWESFFLVIDPAVAFQPRVAPSRVAGIPPALDISAGPWKLDLTDKRGRKQSLQLGQLKLWDEMPATQTFSGEGIYRKTITVPPQFFNQAKGFHQWLDLGSVHECAKVFVNGAEVGDLWMQPYRIDVSGKLKPGENQIEIRVVNLDANYVTGAKIQTPIPAALQSHFGTAQFLTDGAQARSLAGMQKRPSYVPSGLEGPVTLRVTAEMSAKP